MDSHSYHMDIKKFKPYKIWFVIIHFLYFKNLIHLNFLKTVFDIIFVNSYKMKKIIPIILLIFLIDKISTN